MTQLYNQQLIKNRRKDLRSTMTGEERILWSVLRKYLKDARFRRQYSVGYYILDFYSPKYRLCIELDGSQHLLNKEYDKERDDFLLQRNIKVLRFTNKQIRQDLGNVMYIIKNEILETRRNRSLGSPC